MSQFYNKIIGLDLQLNKTEIDFSSGINLIIKNNNIDLGKIIVSTKVETLYKPLHVKLYTNDVNMSKYLLRVGGLSYSKNLLCDKLETSFLESDHFALGELSSSFVIPLIANNTTFNEGIVEKFFETGTTRRTLSTNTLALNSTIKINNLFCKATMDIKMWNINTPPLNCSLYISEKGQLLPCEYKWEDQSDFNKSFKQLKMGPFLFLQGEISATQSDISISYEGYDLLHIDCTCEGLSGLMVFAINKEDENIVVSETFKMLLAVVQKSVKFLIILQEK